MARELVKVHQLRSKFGRRQLFRRCLDDASREGNPIITSHRAQTQSRSPSMMCSLSRNATSLHHAPYCNHVSVPLVVWCSQFVRMQHQLRCRDRPHSRRLSGASVVAANCSRPDLDCRSGGSLDLWIATEHQLHRREHGLKQASVSLCRISDVSESLSPKKTTACTEHPSQTT